MSDSDLNAYLEELGSALRFDAVRRERIVEEARAHIEDGRARGLARGLSPEDALHRALIEFGGAEEVARRFAMELREPLFAKRRLRYLSLALIAQAASLPTIPVLLRFASEPLAKCLISGMFACIGAFLVGDVVRLGWPSLRRPMSWALLPYLVVSLPFFAANIVHRTSQKMSFDVFGVPATAIHSIMVALFLCLAATTIFEIVQTRRLARP